MYVNLRYKWNCDNDWEWVEGYFDTMKVLFEMYELDNCYDYEIFYVKKLESEEN